MAQQSTVDCRAMHPRQPATHYAVLKTDQKIF